MKTLTLEKYLDSIKADIVIYRISNSIGDWFIELKNCWGRAHWVVSVPDEIKEIYKTMGEERTNFYELAQGRGSTISMAVNDLIKNINGLTLVFAPFSNNAKSFNVPKNIRKWYYK